MGDSIKKVVKKFNPIADAKRADFLDLGGFKRKEQEKKAREAEDRAKADAQKAEARARRSQVFAETEGQGTGQFGQVQLGVSESIDEEEELDVRQGRSTLKV